MINEQFNTTIGRRTYQARATDKGITVSGSMLNVRGARLPMIQKQIADWLREAGYPINWDGRKGVRIDAQDTAFASYSPYRAQQMFQDTILKPHMKALPAGKALVEQASNISRRHHAAKNLGLSLSFSEQHDAIRGLKAEWEGLIILEAAHLEFPFKHILPDRWAWGYQLPYTDYQYRQVITLQEGDLSWIREKAQAVLRHLDMLEASDQV